MSANIHGDLSSVPDRKAFESIPEGQEQKKSLELVHEAAIVVNEALSRNEINGFEVNFPECVEEVLKESLEFEIGNFRIDSFGWHEETLNDWTVVKIHPEGDVFECVSGEFRWLKGEQFFTPASMLRETEKAGKRVPTIEEWSRFAWLNGNVGWAGNGWRHAGWYENVSVREALGLRLCGAVSRHNPYHVGEIGHYLAKDGANRCGASLLSITEDSLSLGRDAFDYMAYSVRCLK